MGRKLLLPFAAIALSAAAFAPPAFAAARIANHRALKRPVPAAASESPGGPLIAPLTACPQQEAPDAGTDAQEGAMRCMVEFARGRAGLAPLAASPELDLSAAAKTNDVLACDSFSHEACGREFAYWIKQSGYTAASCWHVGENLAWGVGDSGTVRSIFRAWMRSPGHRRNVLGEYTELGLSLANGPLEGQAAARVWTAHFGSHCDDTP